MLVLRKWSLENGFWEPDLFSHARFRAQACLRKMSRASQNVQTRRDFGRPMIKRDPLCKHKSRNMQVTNSETLLTFAYSGDGEDSDHYVLADNRHG